METNLAVGLGPSEDSARRAKALARWRRRSEVVHFYRRALPIAMGALVAFALVWIAVRSLIAHFHAGGEVTSIHMIRPVYYGRDAKGQPYVMWADSAVRDGRDPDKVILTQPRFRQKTTAPEPERVTADHGVYHEQAKLLDLTGHVRATDGQDNHFEAEFAHVNMDDNSVVGQVPCYGYGPSGTLRALAYQIYDKGQHMIFTGSVHTHLLMTSSKPAATQPAAPKRGSAK